MDVDSDSPDSEVEKKGRGEVNRTNRVMSESDNDIAITNTKNIKGKESRPIIISDKVWI
jgi:hypothetical protein